MAESPPASGWRTWLPRVLVESALIVFSVLLALALDQWREGYANRQHASAAHREILEELRLNQAAVHEALQYHSTLMDSLAVHQAQATTPSAQLFSQGFISPAQISRTAWESASETGALTHMDFPAVLRLSRIYAQQERYAEQTRNIGQVLYAELFGGGPVAIVRNHRNLASIIGTFAYRERQLLAHYEQILSASPDQQAP